MMKVISTNLYQSEKGTQTWGDKTVGGVEEQPYPLSAPQCYMTRGGIRGGEDSENKLNEDVRSGFV